MFPVDLCLVWRGEVFTSVIHSNDFFNAELVDSRDIRSDVGFDYHP